MNIWIAFLKVYNLFFLAYFFFLQFCLSKKAQLQFANYNEHWLLLVITVWSRSSSASRTPSSASSPPSFATSTPSFATPTPSSGIWVSEPRHSSDSNKYGLVLQDYANCNIILPRIKINKIGQGIWCTTGYCLHLGWGTSGLQPAYGPRNDVIRPAKATADVSKSTSNINVYQVDHINNA